ncbi:sialate O-acetylesterase [Mongoliibacter ruber]|uniref:Sialate O-acetylesterase n=2 Tax=Mongoliibacter ruber TaxID=1750599 RepID=A0A2T0WCN4_9BACT|nr:sialate O-acetylesterase [Mongoliibacter ruber]
MPFSFCFKSVNREIVTSKKPIKQSTSYLMKLPSRSKTLLLIFLLTLIASARSFADITLPKLISSGMVLQRDSPIKIWGWAYPSETIQVIFLEETHQTIADKNGNWSLKLKPLPFGGPFNMLLKGQNEIVLEDILIGDVWLASGQSNMEINMQRVSPLYEEDIKSADFPFIRYFEVPKRYDFKTENVDLPSGKWQTINQSNILSISAISFFFARAIHEKQGVPIGIINSALGGSPVEAWISEESIKQFPDYYDEVQRFKNDDLIEEIERKDAAIASDWYRRLNQNDKGYQDRLPWYAPETDSDQWKEIENPSLWKGSELEGVNGVVWFRRDVELPANWSGKAAKLNLGTLVDADSVFVNGKFVGSTGYQYPPRRYSVPEGVLKTGQNTIVVRLISNIGEGGFVPDKPYELVLESEKIPLEGKWKFQVGSVMEALPPQTFIRWKPVGLFNAMIAPLKHFTKKGVIWYQGESNADRPEDYAKLFQTMINDWRNNFGQGDLPFLYVQLPNFMKATANIENSNWAKLREAQLQALALPNTGMAVAIDLGEWNDIHPLNKKDVAERLALLARFNVYGESDLTASGPMYKSHVIENNKVILSFEHIGEGLVAKNGKSLKHFAIAGDDMEFLWAEAKIERNQVVVWHENITNPKAVKYAWSDNPEGANLFNKSGLPASPFRTSEELFH